MTPRGSGPGLALSKPIGSATSPYECLPQFWVAVKELNLSYYIGETLLFIIYTHYGNLI